jgi:hypothetical protein
MFGDRFYNPKGAAANTSGKLIRALPGLIFGCPSTNKSCGTGSGTLSKQR